jgi:hypothetical protein
VDAIAHAVEAGWRRELFAMLEAQPALFPSFPATLPPQDAHRYHAMLDALDRFSAAESRRSEAYLAQIITIHQEWRDCLLGQQQAWLAAHME